MRSPAGRSQTRSLANRNQNVRADNSPHKSTIIQVSIDPDLFNPGLTLLKSSRNAGRLRYSHWGGTDHEDLKNPCQRRGPGSSILRQAPAAEASLPRYSLATLPARNFPSKPLPVTCHGEAFYWIRMRGPAAETDASNSLGRTHAAARTRFVSGRRIQRCHKERIARRAFRPGDGCRGSTTH